MVKIIKSRQPTRRELIHKERVQKAAAVSVDQHGQEAEDPLLVPSSRPGSLGAASNTARRGRNFIRPRARKSGGIRNPVKVPAHSPRQSPVIVHRKAVFSDSSSGSDSDRSKRARKVVISCTTLYALVIPPASRHLSNFRDDQELSDHCSPLGARNSRSVLHPWSPQQKHRDRIFQKKTRMLIAQASTRSPLPSFSSFSSLEAMLTADSPLIDLPAPQDTHTQEIVANTEVAVPCSPDAQTLELFDAEIHPSCCSIDGAPASVTMDASIYSPDGQPGAPTVEPPLLNADCGGFGWCPLDDRDTMPEDLTSTSEFGSSGLLVLPLPGPTSCTSFELVEDDDPLDNPISLCQAIDPTCSESPRPPLLLLVPDVIQYKDDDSLGGYSGPFRLSDLDSPLNMEYKSPVAPKSALDSFPTSPRNGSWLCSDSHPSFGMRVLEIQAAVVRLPQAVCGDNDASWKSTWALAPPLLQSPTSQSVASNSAGFKDITIFEEPSPNTSPYVCLPRKPSFANIHPSPCILSNSPPCTTEAEDILCVAIDQPMDIISADLPVLSVGSTDETAAPSIFASSVGEQTVVLSSVASVALDPTQNNIGKLPAQIKPASYATQSVKPSEPPKAKGLVHIISEDKASTVSPVTDVSKGKSGPIYSLASGARLPPCYSWATAYTRRVDTLPGMRMVLARPPPLSPHQSSATCLDYHMEYQAKMLMPLHTELKDTRLNYGDNMRTTETAIPTPGWLPALVRVPFSKVGALWMGLGFGS